MPARESPPNTATGMSWPSLRVDEWAQTRATFHLWTQIVGKIRMVLTPALNHWWHVPLYVSPRGLSTGTIPSQSGLFEIEFDLIEHELAIRSSDGRTERFALEPMSVADFSERITRSLTALGIHATIHGRPNEVDPAIPFAEDDVHHSYDPVAVRTFWEQLVQAHRALSVFRASFTGKCSPVHVFWGALDIAVTRFSGRAAPEHPGGVVNCPDRVMVEGYSHEISSAGFWPGGGAEGAFYSYAYPVPAGYAEAPVPAGAFFSEEYGEFLLPYETVRVSTDPDRLVADFLQATFIAARDLARWDDVNEERP